jgi:hypothetical protein
MVLLPSSLHSLTARVECSLPIVVRPHEDSGWHATIEFPPEFQALRADVQVGALNTVLHTLGKLSVITVQTSDLVEQAHRSLIKLNCGLWIRRHPGDNWLTHVTFSWPALWADVNVANRKAILDVISAHVLESCKKIETAERRS